MSRYDQPAATSTPSSLTRHASIRMQQRRINASDVDAALRFGRIFYAWDAVFHVIGHREIARFADIADLRKLHGLHVVCSSEGAVITTYKRQRFHRKDFARSRGAENRFARPVGRTGLASRQFNH